MAYIGKVIKDNTTYHVGSTLYGTCDTAAATVAKVAIVDGFDTLETGVTVHIKFTNANTATGPTLAIKPSSSGTAVTAKSIKKNGTTAPGTTAATSWMDGSVVSFTYDGTYWQMNDHIDDTHQTIKQDGVTGATVNRFGTCNTAANTAAKTVSITTGTFSLEAGATIAVKFTNANTANNPTLNVNSTGAKDMYVNNTKITTSLSRYLLEGTVIFIYDGSRWNLIGNYYDSDVSVMQNNSTSNSDYRLLLSTTAMDGTETSYCNKSANFKANPSTGNLTIGGQLTDKYGLQSFRSLTTAQYNALSSTEKNNGTYYHLTDSYSDVSFDSNVSQTPTTADHDYRVLLSGSDNDTASVEGALKNADLIYNPYKHELRLYEDVSATAANYVQIYPNLINIHSNIDQMRVESNDIWYNNSWDGTNNSLKSTISSLKQSLSNYIKLKWFTLPCNSLSTNMDLTSHVVPDSGYKFFAWQIMAVSNNWVTSFPIYLSQPFNIRGLPWWQGTMPTSSAASVSFFFFEIKNV